MLITLAIIVAILFAMNIGGSGAAASMGIAYGTGAINRKYLALSICACGILLGAFIGSEAVIQTLGTGLISSDSLSFTIAVIILTSACITLFIANRIGIPLSTSEVTVGAIVGVGFIYHTIFIKKLIFILVWWMVTPFLSFIVVFCVVTFINTFKKQESPKKKSKGKLIVVLVIIAGFVEAFSAGMNNVANAVGPLVGSNILSMESGMMIGGIFIALGAIVLGGKVLETNGKKITTISLRNGAIISFTGAFIVIIASLCGIPIPMTQVTTSGIVGAGVAENGRSVLKSTIFKKIVITWVASPVLAFSIAYLVLQIIVEQSTFHMITASIISILLISMYVVNKLIRKQNMLKRGRV